MFEDRGSRNSIVGAWLSYFNKSRIKSPNIEILLFSFDKVSNKRNSGNFLRNSGNFL